MSRSRTTGQSVPGLVSRLLFVPVIGCYGYWVLLTLGPFFGSGQLLAGLPIPPDHDAVLALRDDDAFVETPGCSKLRSISPVERSMR